MQENGREQWGTRVGFIFAAVGSAVGLGNLWRFPHLTGSNGGAAFLIIYLIIIALIGITIMLSELAIGRATQLNAVGAFKKLSKKWTFVGVMGVIAGFVILSYYSVIGGWSIGYMVRSLTGVFSGDTAELFGSFVSNTWEPLIWHAVFMGLTIGIVYNGIKGGIERASKIMIPALFIMLIIIIVRSLTLPGAAEGVAFYLKPDFSKVTGGTIMAALGQAFFSLSLGMGCMVTYGSYLSKKENLVSSSAIIPISDTLAAFLAGLAILPAVFAFGFDPSSGPGLMFITLPAVFAQMPLGTFFGFLFFVLVTIAALTSAISLLEVCSAYVIDEWKWSRKKTTLIMGLVIFLLGIPSSLSQDASKRNCKGI
jgi:NSS family neurotransmitter:Na+ symporter